MKVDVATLRGASAFDLAPQHFAAPPRQVSAAGGAPIRIVDVRDVAYLPDVLEAGQSVSLLPDGSVPFEAVLDPFAVQFLAAFRERGLALHPRYQGVFESVRSHARVCILGNLFSRNFGHWTEELLKVAVLLDERDDCQFVMPSTMPPFAAEFLSLLGVGSDRLLQTDVPTIFDRAVFTTAINHQNLADFPAALDLLRKQLLSTSPGTSGRGRRLWLERGAQVRNGGLTVNADEVYRCLEPFGFDIVDLGTLPVADQLALVRDAEVIAGPHGSQFVHVQFMPPRSTVVECFSPIHVNASVLSICRVLGHDYRQVVGRCNLVNPYRHGRDCLVDCEHLSLVLESICA